MQKRFEKCAFFYATSWGHSHRSMSLELKANRRARRHQLTTRNAGLALPHRDMEFECRSLITSWCQADSCSNIQVEKSWGRSFQNAKCTRSLPSECGTLSMVGPTTLVAAALLTSSTLSAKQQGIQKGRHEKLNSFASIEAVRWTIALKKHWKPQELHKKWESNPTWLQNQMNQRCRLPLEA